MAEQKKRGCLGCSFPLLIIIVVIFLVITVLGFLAGPIGTEMIGEMTWLDWMRVDRPDPHLPAPELFSLFGLPITNTVISGWITVVFLVIISWVVTRRMKIVPGRLQAAFEFLLSWVLDLCKSVAGEENGRRFFPVIVTIFLFVAFNAWLSLIPGFGSIEITIHGHHYELFRGANTDVNTPLAIAVISFVVFWYYGFKAMGVGFLRQYINVGLFFRNLGGIFRGKFNLMGIFSGAIDMFVGGLELLIVFIRIISFTFRLFGNMTAGEILLLVVAFLVPMIAVIPFYGLELLVGFLQALIFAGLTLVFGVIAMTSHAEEEPEHTT